MKDNDSPEAIKERLRINSVSITDEAVDTWDSVVPECKTRYVVAIFLFGDLTATEVVDAQTEDDAGAATVVLNDIPIAPSQIKQFPSGYDIMSPFLSIEGGGQLSFIADAGTPKATVVWYDEP